MSGSATRVGTDCICDVNSGVLDVGSSSRKRQFWGRFHRKECVRWNPSNPCPQGRFEREMLLNAMQK